MNYFRNWTEIRGIEQDALWKLTEAGNFSLVDDDQFIEADQSEAENFYPVDDPVPKN